MNRLPPVTSSSTSLVTVTSPIRHFMSADQLLNLQQVHVKHQGGVGRDRPAGAARAVAEFRRDDQCPLAADLHAGHPLVPTGNNLVRAKRELERLAAVERAVELRPFGTVVIEPPGVIYRDLVAGF